LLRLLWFAGNFGGSSRQDDPVKMSLHPAVMLSVADDLEVACGAARPHASSTERLHALGSS